ncbi:MAG TPA: S-adenosylmethionine:tRNA ribosyltransferase-isomerase [Bacteroidetes bacterium]|nr:S-adenosylmethionine:tRNA ribosyltransferase-isomerase [Bacteroidota bacterium]
MIPDINPEDYSYDLPEEKIAKYPLPHRDQAKLLVYEKGEIQTSFFYDLDKFLRKGDILVVNNTKVIRARLIFHKPTGARIEIFCLEPVAPSDYEQVFSSREPVIWECLIGHAKKWKRGPLEMDISVGENKIRLVAERTGTKEDASRVRFSWSDSSFSFGDLLEAAGAVPIPPYLKREATPADTKEYQTVYALRKGSVAAPTAGLHFTPEMMKKIREAHPVLELTLHVGVGTFRPIQTGSIEAHSMHTEHYTVSRSFLEQFSTTRGRVLAVGTTSVRTLESLYWLAVKILKHKHPERMTLFTDQWDPYMLQTELSSGDAINILLEYMDKNHLEMLQGSTRLMIVPGYRFRFLDGLITNFHLPKSTLLLLVAAFTGDDWKKIYRYALDNDFRFLSYGDASLLLP